MRLKGRERSRLRRIFLDAYDRQELRRDLAEWDPPRDLEDLVSEGPFSDQVAELLACAERRGWLDDLAALLRHQRAERPEFADEMDAILDNARQRPAPAGEGDVDGGDDDEAAPSLRWIWIGVGGAVALLLLLGGWWWFGDGTTEELPPDPDPVAIAERPHLLPPELKPRPGGEQAVEMEYENARAESGVRLVRLWYRLGRDGRWEESREARTGVQGTLRFEELSDSGVYYFDAQTFGLGGESSPEPIPAANGQRDIAYVRSEDVADAEVVEEVYREKVGSEALGANLEAYYVRNRSQIEAHPEAARVFRDKVVQAQMETEPSGTVNLSPAQQQDIRQRLLQQLQHHPELEPSFETAQPVVPILGAAAPQRTELDAERNGSDEGDSSRQQAPQR